MKRDQNQSSSNPKESVTTRKPYHKPVIKSSEPFEKQALSCSRANVTPPYCRPSSS